MYKHFKVLGFKFVVSLETLLILAIAIGVLLRLINLGSREFWYDEVLSLLLSTGQKTAYRGPKDLPVVLAQYTPLLDLPPEATVKDVVKTVVNLLKGLAGGEPHPPLFFLAQHVWLRLFGNGVAAVRSLGALLSVGAIASSYGLGRVLLGHRAGLLLAALLATNPFYLFHSLNVRMYGPLVLWSVLSAWALLEIIGFKQQKANNVQQKGQKTQEILWSLIFIGSVTAGLMTFYLFAYWVVALAVVVLYLDWRRWWHHGLRFGSSVLLTVPWVLWGTKQQLRNADLGRFDAPAGFLGAAIAHLGDVVNTLGTHLLLGDWVTSLPQTIITTAGVAVIGLLLVAVPRLWKQSERRTLGVALILGIFPLLLALGLDVVTGKFTLGFGWGRSMIVILPGCLLLLAVGLEQASVSWRQSIAAAVLLLYIGINVGDFTLRPRSMFHELSEIITATSQAGTSNPTSTLIVMNSQAWGHVMRLAYYIPPEAPVTLLARESSDLAPSLEKVLEGQSISEKSCKEFSSSNCSASTPTAYDRVLWLESAKPVWSPSTTEAEKQQVQQVLDQHYNPVQTQRLTGTMLLDNLTVRLYTRSPAT
ncbi:glycosyltransferase family 39 protein [Trichocoleus sp. FACHB-591]|uniref:glycosyltransferase family 39 protein n=1 Tax=Trichocoleus sp. FACHB-591 TaxID=2692872 RepID=UPI001686BD07|nr:glycosyltransferase family 39 protein [Trichocoleus sp. FACHB-591]MBD2097825.1 glycosyltransferase family 39 protein [Trichocoleus sp. FACHB-591]